MGALLLKRGENLYTIKLGKTSKKINETSHSYTNIGTYTVSLKRPCTIDKPVFTLKTNESFDTLSRANYLEWLSDLQTPVNGSSYYWVNSVKFIANDLIEISCTRDPFATFKSDITGYTGFVARATSSIDTMIADPNILAKGDLIHKAQATTSLDDTFGVTQLKTSTTWTTIGIDGCTTFNTLVDPQITLDELVNLQSQGGSVWQQFEWGVTNPGQYIKDVIMLPFRFTNGSYTSGHAAWVGNLKAPLSPCYIFDGDANNATPTDFSPDAFFQAYKRINMPSLHYAADDFRNYSGAFTNLRMYLPFVGNIQLPVNHLKADYWGVNYFISGLTGKGKVQVNAYYANDTDYDQIRVANFNIETGVPISVSVGHTNQLQQARDAINIARSEVGLAANATKPTPAGLLTAVADLASNSLETAAHAAAGYQEYTSIGSNGSLVEAFNYCNDIKVTIEQYDSTPTTFSTERGRPVYKRAALSGFSGFVQLLAPSLSIAGATSEEISIINATLASGLYIS